VPASRAVLSADFTLLLVEPIGTPQEISPQDYPQPIGGSNNMASGTSQTVKPRQALSIV